MIKAILVAGLLSLSLPAAAIGEGEAFPKIEIAGHQGDVKINQETLNGKVSIINFWATWCQACKVEIKEMQTEFKKLFAHKDFKMAFVSLDKDPTKAVDWFSNNVLSPKTFLKHLYIDPKFIAAEELEVDSFPMTLIIDQKGKVVKVQKGFKEGDGTTTKLAKIAENLLKI